LKKRMQNTVSEGKEMMKPKPERIVLLDKSCPILHHSHS
jgi:hypothetical protein